ncbi:long-chain fatty acid--CoA ligase [Rhodococcus maanshanensis]|jgi:fatty-acyl-CoA synthase|uniref:acyl-CoA synthetase n=1 Tax=Rhodococcus maanshanensis TaxID=183556 RepID=UPI0022B2F5AB|nr:long-chain fatty acid--CoA ligase [Rhodococcus maanshanensis]MCZ4559121.1 long-chain fatty acid--CoA ligase [Rhodococcus maanshanensis]
MQGIGEWAVQRAQLSGDKVAFVYGERSWTYGEFNDRTDRLANQLRGRFGVRRGDRVAAVVASSVECLEILFASAKLGAIFTPINVRLTAPEIGYVLADLGAELLFAHGQFSQVPDALTEPGVRVRDVVTLGDEYDTLLSDGSSVPVPSQVDRHDVAVIMYTSGTTGRPKGAMLTHENLRANAVAVTSAFGLRKSDVTITALPMFHMGGLGLHTLPFIYLGARNVILPSFDPTVVLELVAKERATQLLLVPTMWQAVTAVPDLERYDLSSLDCALISGAPAPMAVLEFFADLGIPIEEGFGMTECAPSVAKLDAEHVRTKAGSIGRSLFGIETRIVDDRDQDVPAGTVGELLVRGDNVFVGYWMRPEESAEALRGGWFHSGDLGWADEDGFITLVDRRKDMLISGGENVYTREVELAIAQMPQVRDVAVVGAAHAKWGETPVAFVVAKDGETLTEEEVIAFARQRLAGFKTPTSVCFLAALPTTATGKIQKNALRDRLSATMSDG